MITIVSMDLILSATRAIYVSEQKGVYMALNIFEKRIKAWEEQHGSLSPEIQRKIDKLVENYDRTQNVEKDNKVLSITDGTKLVREFKGKRYSVTVIPSGFEYNGRKYKSLSAIANEITGTRWNGKKFFGLLKPEYSAEKKLTKCQVFREETHTAALSRRSSARLNDSDVGLQAQSAETHRSTVA